MNGSIEIAGLTYRLGGQTILAPLDAMFQAGQVCAILGPNGAGKSSLLSLLSLERRMSSGQIWLNGKHCDQYKSAELARIRAVMPQASTVAFDFKVAEVVELGRYPHRLQPSPDEDVICQRAMQLTQVDHLAQRAFNTLSGGEKARVHLARTLAQLWEPMPALGSRWLLLDEPTAALDLAHQHAVMRIAREWAHAQGVGVIAVLHDVNLALRYADQALVLHQGQKVAHGAAMQVIDPALIDRVWGIQSSVHTRSDGLPYLVL